MNLTPFLTPFYFIGRMIVAGFCLAGLTPMLKAQTAVWNGGDLAVDNWSDVDNWTGTNIAAGGFNLQFAGSTRLTPTNDFTAGYVVNSMTFNSGAGAFNVGGNGITLNGNITNSSNSAKTVSLPIALSSGAHGFATTGGGAMTLSGAISGTGVTINRTGAGDVTLGANNSYTGTTNLQAGTTFVSKFANIGSDSAFGHSGAISIAAVTTLSYSGVTDTTDRVITINNSANPNNFADANSSRFTVSNAATNLTLSGGLTGTGTFAARGAGTLTISGLVDLTGVVLHTDTGTLALTNAANSFTGALVVRTGTISVSSMSNGGVNSAMGSGTLLSLGQNSAGTTGATSGVGRLLLTGAASSGTTNRSILIDNGAAGGGALIENSTAGQTATFSGNVSTTTTASASGLTLAGVGNGILSGNITGTPNLLIRKEGTGTWSLSGNNTLSGTTTVAAGTLLANNTTGSATGSGSVITTAASNAVLGGTGSISGGASQSITLSAGTFLMVGNTHATNTGGGGVASELYLGSNSNVAINLAGTVRADIFGDGVGEGADLLRMQTTNTMTLSGALVVVDANSDASTWSTGDSWQLFDWSGVAVKSGTFSAMTLPTLSALYAWDTSSIYTDGIIRVVAVPEPGRVLLGLAGVGAMLLVRRRKVAEG